MHVRTILRVLVLVFAGSVGVAIYWNWQPSTTLPTTATADGGDGSEAAAEGSGEGEDDERADNRPDVAARTENLYILESKNGRDVFAIWAEAQVDYVDGWNTWDKVRVVIFGTGDEGDTEITSDRARTSGEGGSEFDQVVFIGNVLATLPSGGRFTTRRIDYDAITGEVSGCNRNTLLYAGLEVRADCMEFQTAGDVASAGAVAEELHMWDDLVIQTAGEVESGGMPGGLSGRAADLRFRPGGEFVRLQGEPQVTMEGIAIQGDEIVLDVGPDADELRALISSGGARVRLDGENTTSRDDVGEGDAAAEEPDAAEDPGDEPRRAQTLTGEEINVILAEGGGVDVVRASSPDGEVSRLALSGFGRLEAGDLEVSPGERMTARAQYGVVWSPNRDSGPLTGLAAEDLRLDIAGSDLENVSAGGGVRATLRAVDGSERAFEGGQLELGWIDGEMRHGVWPEGIAVTIDGRSLRAEFATLEPDSGAWLLSGENGPSISAPEFDFRAQRMRLNQDGGLEATGEVSGTIGGTYLAAAAALFGDTQAVQLEAGSARVATDGALTLRDRVQIVWQTQSLTADEIRMESEPGRLRASGGVELVAVTGSEADYVTVSAENLLVEESTSEVRVAGDAELRQARRRIAAETMVVTVDENGDWSQVFAEDDVEFEDDRARGSGVGLEYSMGTRDLRLAGDDSEPALFSYEGVDPPAEYRSNEELHVSYSGEAIVIESTEDGRATTSVVPRTVQER